MQDSAVMAGEDHGHVADQEGEGRCGRRRIMIGSAGWCYKCRLARGERRCQGAESVVKQVRAGERIAPLTLIWKLASAPPVKRGAYSHQYN